MTKRAEPRLRPAQASDAAEVARLAGQLGYPVEPAAMAARLARADEDPRALVVVAPGEDGLVGWIEVQTRVSIDSPDAAEIVGLVVDAACRRGGTGRALMRAAREWAEARGLSRLRVRTNVVRVDSPRFYTALGFRETKQQRVFALDL